MKLRSRAARRYASALHDLATSASALESVSADVATLRGMLEGSGDLRSFIPNYLIPSHLRTQALAALFADRLHPLVWRFVRFIETKRRLGMLEEICADFQEQEEVRKGILRGQLDSAFEVESDVVNDLAVRMGARIGKTVLLKMEEKPGLLGGGRLQVGDTVYDYSLAARLRLLRQTMMAG